MRAKPLGIPDVFYETASTAYMGGAAASHLQAGSPLFTHVLFGVYLALLAWGGLYIRDARVRALLALRLPAAHG
jgi:hypothetical protein